MPPSSLGRSPAKHAQINEQCDHDHDRLPSLDRSIRINRPGVTQRREGQKQKTQARKQQPVERPLTRGPAKTSL